MKPTVWVTGAKGLIGNYLVQTAGEFAPGWKVVGLGRDDFDLLNYAEVERRFRAAPPRFIIHCAAISRGPACQADPAFARRVNVDATGHLAGLAAGIPFVFLSTDLVFDGLKGDYTEADIPNPLSVYAETKTMAEQLVLKNPRHAVVRTSLNGGASPSRDRGFNEELRRAWIEGRAVTLFVDEYRCPIPAMVTSRALWELVERYVPGVYHLAGAERVSRWRLGELVAARWPQLSPKIQPGTLASFNGPPRPPDTSLNCSKIQLLLSFKLPGISEWLAQHPTEVF